MVYIRGTCTSFLSSRSALGLRVSSKAGSNSSSCISVPAFIILSCHHIIIHSILARILFQGKPKKFSILARIFTHHRHLGFPSEEHPLFLLLLPVHPRCFYQPPVHQLLNSHSLRQQPLPPRSLLLEVLILPSHSVQLLLIMVR